MVVHFAEMCESHGFETAVMNGLEEPIVSALDRWPWRLLMRCLRCQG